MPQSNETNQPRVTLEQALAMAQPGDVVLGDCGTVKWTAMLLDTGWIDDTGARNRLSPGIRWHTFIHNGEVYSITPASPQADAEAQGEPLGWGDIAGATIGAPWNSPPAADASTPAAPIFSSLPHWQPGEVVPPGTLLVIDAETYNRLAEQVAALTERVTRELGWDEIETGMSRPTARAFLLDLLRATKAHAARLDTVEGKVRHIAEIVSDGLPLRIYEAEQRINALEADAAPQPAQEPQAEFREGEPVLHWAAQSGAWFFIPYKRSHDIRHGGTVHYLKQPPPPAPVDARAGAEDGEQNG